MPRLRRVRDGAGDSGSMSMNYPAKWDEDQQVWKRDRTKEPVAGRPRLHYACQVGAVIARTYQAQDYWMTTPVTEIIEDRDDYVRFRTTNSEYEWWA